MLPVSSYIVFSGGTRKTLTLSLWLSRGRCSDIRLRLLQWFVVRFVILFLLLVLLWSLRYHSSTNAAVVSFLLLFTTMPFVYDYCGSPYCNSCFRSCYQFF
ncbi:hypothetical protein L211DRAFT_576920 [Terfezia boudieri ATCC MYA-4762]|uniref:Uncharacterized protein n=1 Tax=Terfezia boudieri ATCC MYA-4762 TaxID=1051890 RepID=A0A3N4LB12_9PEZI|nr:hypothetical protein L211DRAFT_576920 [Terfezia boudieri ATCC MYA-4762]